MAAKQGAFVEGEGDTVIVVGSVERFFFSSERWSAGSLRTAGGERCKFKGPVYAAQGDNLELRGRWEDDPKWGRELVVSSFAFSRPVDRAGLVEYLSKSEAFRGIGRARAEALVDAAGDDFEAALSDPAALAAKARVPADVVDALAREWASGREANVAMAALARYGITPGRAAKLYAKFGAGVTKIVDENPYWLVGRVPGVGFLGIDKIALAAGIPKTSRERARQAALHALSEQTQDGHTWTPLDMLRKLSLGLLMYDSVGDECVLDASMSEMFARDELVAMTAAGTTAVWRADIHRAETEVMDKLKLHDETGTSLSVGGALAIEPRLNEHQAMAVSGASSSRVSIVTGSAGTGKTFVIDAIARAFEADNLRVALCAPTGKAAKRMQESVGRPAMTIHRLLEPMVRDGDDGESPAFTFTRGPKNPVDADAVVVDEFSMVDVLLMRDLVDALDMRRTRLVLVGDHNQLPPVGPGALLRDAVAVRGKVCPVFELSDVVRQAGTLKANVSATLHGSVAPTVKGQPPALGPWFVFDKHRDADGLRAQLFACLEALSKFEIADALSAGGKRAVDPVWDVQVLSPMHKGPIGVAELNAAMQAWAQRRLGREVPQPAREGQRAPLQPDDKAMCTRNKYGLDVMNGATGRVLRRVDKNERLGEDVVGVEGPDFVAKKAGLLVDFDGRRVAFLGEDAGDLTLAYAITVHKAQGSEFAVSIFVCHSAHKIMLHRGLLYTAVSRARRSSVVLGDPWGWREAASRVLSDKRRTMASFVSGTWR